MNTDTTNCLYVKVNSLEQAKVFFLDVLELEVEQGSFDSNPCVIVKQENGTTIFLSDKSHSKQTKEIVINTTDCIAYYCLLKSKGVTFHSSPTYHNEGLMAEFMDNDGNRYVLLESRRYND